MRTRNSFAALAAALTIAFVTACAPEPPPPPPEIEPGTCFDAVDPGGTDFRYDGPDTGSPNMTTLEPAAEPCAGEPQYRFTLVFASSIETAEERCATRGASFGPAVQLPPGSFVPEPPGRAFLCQGSVELAIADPPTVGDCYDLVTDISFQQGPQEVGNLWFHQSQDGTCSGEVAYVMTAVWTGSFRQATALCAERQATAGAPAEPVWNPLPMSSLYGPNAPIGLWQCSSSQTPPPLGDPPAVGTCFEGSTNGLSYRGGIEDLGNLGVHASGDGTCDGPVMATYTAVWTADLDEASSLCEQRRIAADAPEDPAWNPLTLASAGYSGAPQGLLICTGSAGLPTSDPVTECHASQGGNSDLGIIGPLDTFANAAMFQPGSNCQSWPVMPGLTIVAADSQVAAIALCQAFIPTSSTAIRLVAVGYPTAGSNRFLCGMGF